MDSLQIGNPTRTGRWLMLLVLAAGLSGCRRIENPGSSIALPVSVAPVDDTTQFISSPVGGAFADRPWISHVTSVDLDQDGRTDLLACDDRLQAVGWLRQTSPGKFEETSLATDLPAPVHVEAVDLDSDGDLDLLVACMGRVFPTNEQIGSILILENDGHQRFTKYVVAEHLARVTDIRAGDFDGDGKTDLAVAQFGYDQGQFQWMKNLGHWQFESHVLLALSGAINVCVADVNGDRTLDLVVLFSQQWEEIHLFENDGRGTFTDKIIYGSTNEDYGSSGLSLCDLNRDGKPDVLYTNGDGFDYAEPGARPWHGVQWLENLGGAHFKYHRIGDLPGAYSPTGVDLDGDGATDVVAVSGFNDWKNPASASLVLFKNDGRQNFTPHILARAPTHLVTCVAADLDGTGRPTLVTGGFHAYPPFNRLSRLTLWRQKP